MTLATLKRQIPLDEAKERFLLEVLNAVETIKYGCVQITIQNGKVVQIDKTEKIRFTERTSDSKGGGERH